MTCIIFEPEENSVDKLSHLLIFLSAGDSIHPCEKGEAYQDNQ
jgi:hypothetical protein